MNEPQETSPAGDKPERLYSTAQMQEETGYSRKSAYVFLRDGSIPPRPKDVPPGYWTQTQVDLMKGRRADGEIRVGRPPQPKAKKIPVAVTVLGVLSDLRIRGGRGYGNDKAVLEHCVMHASECPYFEPGNPEMAWNKQGAPEKVDLSGL